MASTARSGDSTAAGAAPDATGREKADAAMLLDLVFGAEVLAAIHEGFLKDGDYRGVLPLLGAPATANAHVRAATQAAFKSACAAGEAGVAGLCLAHVGVDASASVGGRTFLAGVDGGARVGGGGTVLGAAAERGDGAMVRALAASGKVDVNQAATARGCSALMLASYDGHVPCVEALLAVDGIDANRANSEGTTALFMASQKGHAEIVRALLAADGIDANRANSEGTTALFMASQKGHAEIVRALLAIDGIDTNHATNEGSTALFMASQKGHAEIVRALLAADGIDANHANDEGSTALSMASQEGHAEVVRALLATDGIDANHAANDGSTALIYASQDGHAEVVHALLAVDGIDVNLTTEVDCSALMLAVDQHHTSCARALVAAKGVSVNLKSPRFGNSTALHDACGDLRLWRENGATRVEMTGMLLTAGGCRFQLNDAGQTPLDLAAGDKAVLEVFASGTDYWQRRRHGGHGWAMQEAVTTLLLVRQRLDGPAAPPAGSLLVHLPEEIWLAVCAFLRGADFMP